MKQLNLERETLQANESQLKVMNGDLHDCIKGLKLQLQQKEQTCEQMENNSELVVVELNKTQSLVSTINKRYKVGPFFIIKGDLLCKGHVIQWVGIVMNN